MRAHDQCDKFAKSGNNGIVWNAGLTKETDARIIAHSNAISKAMTGKPGRVWSAADKNRHSTTMHSVVLQNPDSYSFSNVCRRVARFNYKDEYLHSSWEVVVAEMLDMNRIRWERKVTPATYIWKEKQHLYFPDFYLPDVDLYIEVKGYEIEKDRAKWAQFPGKLLIIKSKEIKEIKAGLFDIGRIV